MSLVLTRLNSFRHLINNLTDTHNVRSNKVKRQHNEPRTTQVDRYPSNKNKQRAQHEQPKLLTPNIPSYSLYLSLYGCQLFFYLWSLHLLLMSCFCAFEFGVSFFQLFMFMQTIYRQITCTVWWDVKVLMYIQTDQSENVQIFTG